MLLTKKYAVYYRTVPLVLEHHMALDKFMKFIKDGCKTFEDGHKCPRLSIFVEPTGNADTDKQRIKKFEQLLDELAANNQIVGYS